MILYLVRGNTYYDGYGHNEVVYGIFTDKSMAETARDLAIKSLYEAEMANWNTEIEDISDIDVSIIEIEANNTSVTVNLGGYIE